MSEGQLDQILQLVQGIAGKQEASEARLVAVETAQEQLLVRSREAQPVKVKMESEEGFSGDGLSLEEAESMLERQRKYVLERRRGAAGSGSSMSGLGSSRKPAQEEKEYDEIDIYQRRLHQQHGHAR